MNTLLALQPMQGVKDTGTAIYNAGNALFRGYQQGRANDIQDNQIAQKNKLFEQDQLKFQLQDMAGDAYELKNLMQNGADAFQLYDAFDRRIAKVQERRGDPSHTIKLKQQLQNGQITPEQFNAELDGIIGKAQQLGVFGGQEAPARAEIGRFKTETLPDGSVITLDSATNSITKIANPETVDLSVLPENVRADVENLPLATKKEIVKQYASPKGQESIKTAAEKEQKGKELKDRTLAMINELLGDENAIKSAVGGVDEMFPTLLSSTKDAEAALDDLRNLLTVENLGIMSGVLSESDMKIIRSIGANGLSGSDKRVINRLKEMRTALGGENFQQEATNEPKQIGRYKVKAR